MVKCKKCGTFYKVSCHICYPDEDTKIEERITELLSKVDFTMGCNGGKNILPHIKRLVDFYIDTTATL